VHTRPGDGPSKGKIERFWRTRREQLLERLDAPSVSTLDDLNLRLWSFVEGEYHTRPHAALAGKTPLDVWDADAEDLRWPSAPAALEQAFHATVDRLARQDSTVLWRGVWYEVPPYLRGRTVRLRYSLLDAERVSVLDGAVEIPLRRVNPTANAQRSRPQLGARSLPPPDQARRRLLR